MTLSRPPSVEPVDPATLRRKLRRADRAIARYRRARRREAVLRRLRS